jgi:hypothetical protein
MKKICLLALLCQLISCDDGDFNVPSFDFDGLTINDCGNITLYKITSESSESLILQLNEDNTDDVFLRTAITNKEYAVTSNGEHSMSYRIFNGDVTSNYFCQEIPSSTPTVSEEWIGDGALFITNTITLNDNDGVPTETENNLDITIFGAVPDTFDINDIDGDGYPNYIDTDDDGDGKPTSEEDWDITLLPPSRTGDPTSIDTDGDGIPNYLDANDDGDDEPSLTESSVLDDNNDAIVDYLDNATIAPIEAGDPITNTYTQSYSMFFQFSKLNLTSETSTISYPDGYTYGTKTGSYTSSEIPVIAEE